MPLASRLCTKCGASSPFETSSCPHCGSVLDLEATQVMAAAASGGGGETLDVTQALESQAQTGWASSAAPQAATYESIVPGSVLGGRYEILRLLGEGGMGAVFQARDCEVDRVVALKVIRPALAGNDEILRMFKQELILARQVTHSNIIRIYDLGLVNDLRFITMQFVEGRDLHSLLSEKGAFSPEEAAEIIVQVCQGLDAAHQQKVVHRDLKPHNIMINAEGKALVMDFGLAHSTETGGTEGSLLGTPQYMSPEQANREELDPRSDLYSIGIILYQMLTGSLPFEAASLKAMLKHRIHGKVQPPIERDPSIPKALNTIVMKCLARAREERYQAAAEIVYDLQVWQGVVVPPSKLWKRTSVAFAALLVISSGFGIRAYIKRPLPAPKPVSMLVGDFQNATGEHVLDGTLEPLFTEAMERSPFITAYPRARAHALAGQVKAGAAALNGEVARLVALREAINVVVAGSIRKSGSSFEASATAVDATTGKTVAESHIKAASKEKLAADLPKLAAPIRQALGDRTPAASKTEAGETFTATSLAAAQEYSLGQELQAAGRYADAVQHYKKALNIDPDNGRAYSGIGVSYRNLDNLEEAEKNLKIALSKSGQMSERERYRTRGAYYVTIKNYEKAADEYKNLIQKFPADNAGLANLALCYTYLRDLPKVIDSLQKAVAIYPKNARQRMNLAEGYLYGGKFDEAVREADEVLKLNPSFERAYVAKAIAALATGKPDSAVEFYQKAGTVGKRYSVLGLADLALFEGRPNEAVPLLQKGVKSDLADGHKEWAVLKEIALGQAYLMLGQRPNAVAAATQALKDTKDETLMFLAARILVESGQEAQARAVAETLSKELYNEPLAYGKLLEGEVALKKGQVREAIQAMMDARAHVDTWIGHYDLGRAYLSAKAFPEADSEFDACLNRRGEAGSLDLNLDPTYSYLPPVYFESGRAKEGIGSPAAADAFRAYLGIKAKADHDPLVAQAKASLKK